MTYDLVVRGSTIVTTHDTFAADVAIRGEHIAAIGDGLRGAHEIDAAGMYVIPRGGDGHVPMGTNRATDIFDDTLEARSSPAAVRGGTTMAAQAPGEGGAARPP